MEKEMTEKKPGIELKPCPFCAHSAALRFEPMEGAVFIDSEKYYSVECINCGAEIVGDDCIEEWNTRPTDEQHAKELEEAFEAAKKQAIRAVEELWREYPPGKLSHCSLFNALQFKIMKIENDYKKNGGGGE